MSVSSTFLPVICSSFSPHQIPLGVAELLGRRHLGHRDAALGAHLIVEDLADLRDERRPVALDQELGEIARLRLHVGVERRLDGASILRSAVTLGLVR